MNILYIDHYAGGPEWGMEYRPYYLAREWVRVGHRVAIVAASQAHVRRRQPSIDGHFGRDRVDGVDYRWCRTPAYRGNGVGRVINIVAFLLRLGQWRRWLDFRPDVVIASSTYPADIGPAQRIARAHDALLVWEVHDLWPLSPIELGGLSRRHPFIVWMQRAEDRACRSADLVVSMLPKADSHLREHGMAGDKFVYVPNGIDRDEWQAEALEAPPAAHAEAVAKARSAGRCLVAYAGAHGVANALGSMLDAATLCRSEPLSWFLVGDGPEKPALARRIAAERLDNVVLLDPIPKAAIPGLLQSMDLLYIGLRREPLFRFGVSPNKLMDYMMSGRPVVCAIAAGNDPVTEAGCGLTIAPEDPVALAAAARRVCALPEQDRAAMGARGRAWVEANHTYPVLARRFLDAVMARRCE